MGYLDHQRSRIDRRSVRIKLTDKGREVRDIVDALYQKHVATVVQVGGIDGDEFAMLNRSLQRLERFWTDQILYRLWFPFPLSALAPARCRGIFFRGSPAANSADTAGNAGCTSRCSLRAFAHLSAAGKVRRTAKRK